MKLLIVIVNYHVADLTIDCLHSVAAEISSVPDTRVAVCENGTGDDSAERIQAAIDENGWSGWCSLTAITPNLGFTGGNNVILRAALQSSDPPDYVLLLNADTIVRPNAVRALVNFMDEHPKVGIAGSRLEDPDGTPQRSAFRFQTPISEFETALRLGLVSKILRPWVTAPPPRNDTFQTGWVPGASMIIRKQVSGDIGLLDEDFYTYYDDMDFCFNARQAGWPTWYVPKSRVVHLVGRTTGVTGKQSRKRQPAYVFLARRRYFLKNHGAVYAALCDAGRILGLTFWKVRVKLSMKEDITPMCFLRDTISHSVFVTGFSVRPVPNPVLQTHNG